MKTSLSYLLVLACILLSFLSGLMLSSFYIGDRNLLVTLATLVTVVITGTLTYKVIKRKRNLWTAMFVVVEIVLAIAGFLCSVNGIC